MNAKRHDRLSLVLPTILVVALTLAPSLAADPSEDWPRWNGPRLDLTAPGSEVFSGSEIGLESAWTKDLGSGYSGIVVVGDALVTAFSDGESDFFVALDAASGEERWRYRIAKTYKGHDGSDDGPLSSPLIADGRVYGLGPWGHLFAVRLDNGQELWAQKVDEGGGARKPEYGFTTAPTLVDGVLIVQTGGPEGHSISGFDPANGKRLWATADDSVSYQSPLPMRIDGTTQVLAVTDAHLIGLDPKNGEILWQEVHPEGVSYGSAQPVPLGDGKVLLPDWRGAALVQVSRADGGGYAVEELWKSRGFRGTYTVPVPHEGHIYGYSGNFLSAVDAATGEVVWKSRPPGRGNLVLVDGHLVIQASSGEIVIAEATPEGYKEKARLKALEKGYLTAPAFASGRVYVRNLEQIAAIGVTERASASAPAEPAATEVEPKGMIAGLAERVAAAPDAAAKKKVVEAFLAKRESFPIVEDGSGDGELVHFVYHGEVEDLALSGNFLDGPDRVMGHLPGTDFYHYSVELPRGGVFTYSFAIFDRRITDPRNSRTGPGLQGEVSVLLTGDREMPAHLDEPDGERGRLESFTWKSEIRGDEREVQVYLPPGYDAGDARHPLLIVHYGQAAIDNVKLVTSLDNLIGESVEPVIAAFVPRQSFAEYAGSDGTGYARALAEELVPHVDATYRTIPEAASRAIVGWVSGAAHAMVAATSHPDIFSKVAIQSYYFGELGDDVKAKIAEGAAKDLDVYVEIRGHEYENGPVDAAKDSRELVELLGQADVGVTVHELPDGAGWVSWSTSNGRVLEALFPKD